MKTYFPQKCGSKKMDNFVSLGIVLPRRKRSVSFTAEKELR